MALDEKIITRAIIDRYFEKFKENLSVDVAIVGGGPSGLVCSYYLARNGFKVALFERKLSIGGGMWGGGMMFNEIVVQEEGKRILDEFGIRSKPAPKDNPWAPVDAGLAAQNIMLYATSIDLGSVFIGMSRFIEKDKSLLKTLHIADNMTIVAAVICGYPAENPEPREKTQKAEFFE